MRTFVANRQTWSLKLASLSLGSKTLNEQICRSGLLCTVLALYNREN